MTSARSYPTRTDRPETPSALSRSSAVKSAASRLTPIVLLAILGGCITENTLTTSSRSVNLSDYEDVVKGTSSPQSPASSKPRAGSETSRIPSTVNNAEIYESGSALDRSASRETDTGASISRVAYVDQQGVTQAQANTLAVNFENAEIDVVAKAILGDVFNANYSIDPRVKGTITLSTRRPIPKTQLLWLLETALRAQGYVIVHQNGVYRILPATEANAVGETNVGAGAGTPGYGISALPLQNVSAETLSKILDGFGAPAGAVRLEPKRNLLIVRGTTEERQWVLDTAQAFDVDWMRNQTVGIFPIKRSTPDAVINELSQIADTSTIRFQPIVRMNAVLAVSKSDQAIRQISTWIGRLDRDNGYGPQAHVYRLKNGDARKVVAVLKDIFVGSGSLSPIGGDANLPSNSSDKSGATLIAATTAEVKKTVETATPAKGGDSFPAPIDSASGQPKMRITADVSNNAVVVYANGQDYKAIERTIMELDATSQQVAVEAIVAEVTLNDQLNYGVQYYLQNKSDTGSIAQLSAVPPLAQAVPAFNLLLGSQAAPKVVISALRDVTDVKVLSSPSLVVVDNQPAILQVGDQVPVTTATSTQTVTTGAPIVNAVSYVDTGVILRVIPHISRGSQIRLEIEQEVSNVAQNANATTLTPTISQRKIKSTVTVENGQTVLLAGLIGQQRSMEKRGIPGMIDVSILGNLLSNSVNGGQRTELIVFVKPQVIRNTADAQHVAAELRRRMPGFNNW